MNLEELESLPIGRVVSRECIKVRYRVTIPKHRNKCDTCDVVTTGKMIKRERGPGRMLAVYCMDCFLVRMNEDTVSN